jgi:putative ABC transport system permease protein
MLPGNGTTEDFNTIQELKMGVGRYISSSEFHNGSPVIVMGAENADKLFGSPEKAVGKQVQIGGRTGTIIGVMKKAGQSMIGGWDFDNIIIVPFNFCRQVVNERNAGRFLVVKGKPVFQSRILRMN